MAGMENNLPRFVNMGEIVLGNGEDRFSTILGSCIAIMMHDPSRKLGAMAHILLPHKRASGDDSIGKYADVAIPEMLEQLVKKGCAPRKIWAKLAGGAAMFNASSSFLIGEKNLVAVREVLGKIPIPVLATHCGGTKGRRVLFHPGSGKIVIMINGESEMEI
ncbi:MAG: chemotaxis protein CheD [Gemmataceae bacterium]|jgi:chemotaxis protein CheD